jgi:hypothetical protein
VLELPAPLTLVVTMIAGTFALYIALRSNGVVPHASNSPGSLLPEEEDGIARCVYCVRGACRCSGGRGCLGVGCSPGSADQAHSSRGDYEMLPKPVTGVPPGETVLHLLKMRFDSGPDEPDVYSGKFTFSYGHGPNEQYRGVARNLGDASLLDIELRYEATFYQGAPFQSPVIGSKTFRVRVPVLPVGERRLRSRKCQRQRDQRPTSNQSLRPNLRRRSPPSG